MGPCPRMHLARVVLSFLYGWGHGGAGRLWMHPVLCAPRPKMRQILLAFTRLTRATIGIYLSDHDQAVFMPSKVPQFRCKALAYTNHMPCIVGLPVIGPDEAKCLSSKLVALRHAFSLRKRKELEVGDLKLCGARISYRAPIPDDWLPLGAGPIRNVTQQLVHDSFQGQVSPRSHPLPP